MATFKCRKSEVADEFHSILTPIEHL